MSVTRVSLGQREGTREEALPAGVGEGPVAARIRLGTRLRSLRAEAGTSRETAAAAIQSSIPKISRVELGRTAVKARDLAELLALYGVSDEAGRESMLALCRQGSARGWWQGYGDAIPAWMKHYLGLEQAAVLIRSYDVQYIPGLLQAPEYAKAVLSLPGGPVGERAERLLAVRTR